MRETLLQNRAVGIRPDLLPALTCLCGISAIPLPTFLSGNSCRGAENEGPNQRVVCLLSVFSTTALLAVLKHITMNVPFDGSPFCCTLFQFLLCQQIPMSFEVEAHNFVSTSPC